MRNRMIGVAAMCVAACSVLVAFAQETRDPKAASAPKAEIGKAAPDFELKDTEGKTVKLSDYKDKVVLLEWVNQQCPYSNDKEGTGALPKMKELQAAYAPKGVVWLSIDSTKGRAPAENAKYRSDKGIQQPILSDADGTVGRAYGARTTPHVFIINKGTLVYAGAHKEKSGNRCYISESLDAVLKGEAVPVATTTPFGCSVKY